MNATTTLERPPAAPPMAPAKLRILETANDLFYDDGIRAVGVDRLIGASRVTKATFYKHFGSKDRLIVAYVGNRHRRDAERLLAIIDHADGPVDALHALQADTVRSIEDAGFRGCAYINAAAEFSDVLHPVRVAVVEHREWYLGMLEDLLRRLGHPLAGEAADDLMLARDGAMSGGYVSDRVAATTALSRAFDRVIAEAGH